MTRTREELESVIQEAAQELAKEHHGMPAESLPTGWVLVLAAQDGRQEDDGRPIDTLWTMVPAWTSAFTAVGILSLGADQFRPTDRTS